MTMTTTTTSTTTTTPSTGHSSRTLSDPQRVLRQRYQEVRQRTLELIGPLSAEDCQVQSMESASPAKWHLAHTTWFFETFLLKPHLSTYEVKHPQYNFMYNSYYNLIGERVARPLRGMMTRPSLDDVKDYRAHIDRAMLRLFDQPLEEKVLVELGQLMQIGLNHEQQHQELLLTDLKHLLSLNPLHPAYVEPERSSAVTHASTEDDLPLGWMTFDSEDVAEFGVDLADMNDPLRGAFAFDNEGPRHRRLVHPFAIATRPVTCGEFMQFIEDGGYRRAELWLAEGWATVEAEGWTQPFYWTRDPDHADGWLHFTLRGQQPVRLDEPLTHISLWEADAYARWAGARLPEEFEWEHAARTLPVEGHLLDRMPLHPPPISRDEAERARDTETPVRMFGDSWEWTRSQYSPYPGYAPAPGAIGEYNGKFMSNQFVLRGGSIATPQSHLRLTYRNFFPGGARWQFAGFRLARDR